MCSIPSAAAMRQHFQPTVCPMTVGPSSTLGRIWQWIIDHVDFRRGKGLFIDF